MLPQLASCGNTMISLVGGKLCSAKSFSTYTIYIFFSGVFKTLPISWPSKKSDPWFGLKSKELLIFSRWVSFLDAPQQMVSVPLGFPSRHQQEGHPQTTRNTNTGPPTLRGRGWQVPNILLFRGVQPPGKTEPNEA